jgi:ribosomal protein L29
MIKDFQKKDTAELQTLLKEKREALLNVRFALSGSHSRKTSEARTLKQEIAQILTLLTTTK